MVASLLTGAGLEVRVICIDSRVICLVFEYLLEEDVLPSVFIDLRV